VVEAQEEVGGVRVGLVRLHHEDEVPFPVLRRLLIGLAGVQLAGQFLDPLVRWEFEGHGFLLVDET